MLALRTEVVGSGESGKMDGKREEAVRAYLEEGHIQAFIPPYAIVGKVVAIDHQGLALEYIPRYMRIGELREVEIFLYDGRQFYTPALRCRVQSDVCDDNNGAQRKYCRIFEYQLCRVRFEPLSQEQVRYLNWLTLDEAREGAPAPAATH
jgi:hypothetical protein